MYYDRQGQPIEQWAWGKLWNDKSYQQLEKTISDDGQFLVSTVWLGIDHGFGRGDPVIFETMVFPNGGSMTDLACSRYTTEEQAFIGHRLMVARANRGDFELETPAYNPDKHEVGYD